VGWCDDCEATESEKIALIDLMSEKASSDQTQIHVCLKTLSDRNRPWRTLG
jgi:hypothetical protein